MFKLCTLTRVSSRNIFQQQARQQVSTGHLTSEPEYDCYPLPRQSGPSSCQVVSNLILKTSIPMCRTADSFFQQWSLVGSYVHSITVDWTCVICLLTPKLTEAEELHQRMISGPLAKCHNSKSLLWTVI